MNLRRPIAQQILPVRGAVVTAAALHTRGAAPVAFRAGEPGAPGGIGVWINRQHPGEVRLPILTRQIGGIPRSPVDLGGAKRHQ